MAATSSTSTIAKMIAIWCDHTDSERGTGQTVPRRNFRANGNPSKPECRCRGRLQAFLREPGRCRPVPDIEPAALDWIRAPPMPETRLLAVEILRAASWELPMHVTNTVGCASRRTLIGARSRSLSSWLVGLRHKHKHQNLFEVPANGSGLLVKRSVRLACFAA
jgi:hypothetical protein